MQIGISFDGFAPFGAALEIAVEAERLGASSIWMAEHLGYRDPIAMCAAFALRTQRARIVPTALSPYLRHPTPTAAALATLAEAAPGRIAVALGVGNPLFLQESGIEAEKPVVALREYVEVLRALWSTQPVQFQGMLYNLAGAKMAFAPPQPIPIYLAPMRPLMLGLAGRIADGLVLSAVLDIAYVRESVRLARAGAEAAKRNFDEVRRAAYIYFVTTRTDREARDILRPKLAFIFRNKFLADSIAFSKLPIDQPAIIEAIGQRDFARAQSLVPDSVVDACAVGGTLDRCVARIKEFVAAGIEEPVLVLAGEPEDQKRSLLALRELTQG
ncbi:MAG: LLM class flavin-dependent oxidoreductase [Alphaproteobacteria bacterium]